MRHCWGTVTRPLQDPATTRTGRETCERETAARVHWYNTRRPLSLGDITPQQAESQHTTTRKEAASTSLHKTRDLTHPLRGIAPATWRCTRYVALHPNRRGAMPTDRVQCLRIGCTTPVTSSHADLPERTSTYPTGLAGPGGAVQSAGWTPGRQGLTGLRDDEPSGRLAALARHKARARRGGTHTTCPGAGRAYNEAGASRALVRSRPRPRQR